jgi:hypothetical protein
MLKNFEKIKYILFSYRGRHPKRAARLAALLGQPIWPGMGLGNNQKLPHSFNDGLLGSSRMPGSAD